MTKKEDAPISDSSSGDPSSTFIRVTLVTYFVATVFSFVYGLFLPLMISMGFSERVSSFVLSGAFLLSAVVNPMMGEKLDEQRPLWVIIPTALMFIVGASPLLIGLPPTLTLLLPVLFVIAHSVLGTLTRKIVEGDVEERQRTKNAMLWYFVHNIAFAGAAVLAYYFLKEYQTTLVLTDLVTSVAFLGFLAWLFLKEKRANSSSLPREKKPFWQPYLLGFEFTRKNVAFSIAVFLIGITSVCHMSAVPVIFSKAGLDATRYTALAYFVNTALVSIVTIWITKRPIKRLNRGQLFVVAAILTGLGHALVPYFLSTGGVVFTTAIWSLGEVLSIPALTLFIFAYFERHQSGLASGIKTYFISVSQFIAPLLVALYAAWTIEALAWFFGLLPIGAVVVFYATRTRVKAFKEAHKPV